MLLLLLHLQLVKLPLEIKRLSLFGRHVTMLLLMLQLITRGCRVRILHLRRNRGCLTATSAAAASQSSTSTSSPFHYQYRRIAGRCKSSRDRRRWLRVQ